MIGFETHEGCVHATERPLFMRVLSTPGVKSGQTNGGRRGNSIIPPTCRGSRSLAEQHVAYFPWLLLDSRSTPTPPHFKFVSRGDPSKAIDPIDRRRNLDKSARRSYGRVRAI